ncbi:hypothetical protein DFAR_3990011 [Desulfarculales bacterium]
MLMTIKMEKGAERNKKTYTLRTQNKLIIYYFADLYIKNNLLFYIVGLRHYL